MRTFISEASKGFGPLGVSCSSGLDIGALICLSIQVTEHRLWMTTQQPWNTAEGFWRPQLAGMWSHHPLDAIYRTPLPAWSALRRMWWTPKGAHTYLVTRLCLKTESVFSQIILKIVSFFTSTSHDCLAVAMEILARKDAVYIIYDQQREVVYLDARQNPWQYFNAWIFADWYQTTDLNKYTLSNTLIWRCYQWLRQICNSEASRRRDGCHCIGCITLHHSYIT